MIIIADCIEESMKYKLSKNLQICKKKKGRLGSVQMFMYPLEIILNNPSALTFSLFKGNFLDKGSKF